MCMNFKQKWVFLENVTEKFQDSILKLYDLKPSDFIVYFDYL